MLYVDFIKFIRLKNNFIENYIQVEQDGFNLGGFSFGFVKIFEECEQYYFKGKYGVVQDEIDDKIVEVD